MAFRLRYAAISDVGRVRKDNQDSGYVGPWMLAVCDGVGGAARGDLASSTAIGQLRKLDAKPSSTPATTCAAQVAGALHRANDRIAELVDDDPALSGTSTTATMALFDGDKLTFGHVGDSRAYLFRGDEIRQLTKDHTFVQTLIDEGRITEEEARTHPHRNLILKAIDGVHDVDADLFDLELEPGDRVLLCSDGASGVLDDGRLADILSMGTPDYAAVELVRASLEAGTTDNVTCLVADVVDEARCRRTTSRRCWSAPPPTSSARPPRRRCRSLFRGHRAGDTGELEPVRAEIPDSVPFAIESDPVDPEEARYAPRPPRRFLFAAPAARGRRGPRRGLDGRRRGVLLEPAAVLRRRRRRHASPSSAASNADLPGVEPVAALRDDQRQPRPAVRLRRLDGPRGHRRRQPRGRPAARCERLAANQSLPGDDAADDRHGDPTGRAHGTATTETPGTPRRERDAMTQSGVIMEFVHRRRRGAELFLLVLALAVGVGAYAAVGLGVEGEVPTDLIALRRLAGRPGRGRPRRGAVRGAVRRPGAAARRGRPQRPRPGGHPPARPGRRHDVRPPAADLDDARRRPVRAHPDAAARPPAAAAVHLHQRAGRDHPAAAADGPRARHRASTARASGSTSGRSASSPARSPSCCWSSPSPATSCSTATRSPWPAGACCSSTCRAAATSARSC